MQAMSLLSQHAHPERRIEPK